MVEEVENVVEETTEQPVVEQQVDESKFESAGDDSIIKVDLSKPLTDETTETEADTAGVVGRDEDTEPTEEQEEVQPQGEVQEAELPVLEEVTTLRYSMSTIEKLNLIYQPQKETSY